MFEVYARTMRRFPLRRTVYAVLALPAIAYATAVVGIYASQRQMLFKSGDGAELTEVNGIAVPGAATIKLTASDGVETSAWYVAPKLGRPMVLFLHGQGGRLAWQVERWQYLREAGAGVLALSYRGYPGSRDAPRSGEPTEDGLHLDARAAFDWLRSKHAARDIIIQGHSLGSGVAVRLAAEIAGPDRIRALVLEAPFTAAVDVAAERMPWAPTGLLMRDQFRSRDYIGRVNAPVLIVHGDRDQVIPIEHGERLFAMAREPKRFVRMPGSGHNGLVRDGLFSHVWAFVKSQP